MPHKIYTKKLKLIVDQNVKPKTSRKKWEMLNKDYSDMTKKQNQQKF